MRLLEKFKHEEHARTFSDYLTLLDIDNQLAIEPDGTCEVWVIDEDDVKHAEQLLVKFRGAPDDPDYKEAAKKAGQKRKQARKEAKEEVPHIDVRTKVFGKTGLAPRGTLTLFLIIVSVVITYLSEWGKNAEFVQKFSISEFQTMVNYITWRPGLEAVRQGQVWRLITPIFIHFHWMHLGFNMLWLYDLGNMIEDRKGAWFLGLFITIVAITSNLAQYMFVSPGFGGMSGVVYGLLGYVWMKSKYDPNSRLFLHKTTVMMMLIWFFLCWTPIIPGIANFAHLGGLVAGVVWGFFTSPGWKRVFK